MEGIKGMNKQAASGFAQKIIIPVGLLGALLYAIGGPWDQMIHVNQGHTPLATPHLIIGAGLSFYVFSGILASCILRGKNNPRETKNSLKLIVLGAVLLPFGLAFDESWHWIFAVDMTAWSPPHIAILFGMTGVLLGLALFETNRAPGTPKVAIVAACAAYVFLCRWTLKEVRSV